jgi:hypothetical protein
MYMEIGLLLKKPLEAGIDIIHTKTRGIEMRFATQGFLLVNQMRNGSIIHPEATNTPNAMANTPIRTNSAPGA